MTKSTQAQASTVAADTSERLLDAAEAVFAERGFDGARIREIARRAKVNSALIQYHFGGKRGLYETLLESRLRRGRQVINTAASIVESTAGMELSRDTVTLAVRTVMRDFLAFAQANPHFRAIMQRERLAGMATAARVISREMPFEPLVKLLDRAKEQGLVRQEIPSFVIVSMLLAVHQHCLDAAPLFKRFCGLDPSSPNKRAEIIDMNLRVLFDGIWREPS